MIQTLRRTTLGFVFLVAGLLSIGLSPSWGQSSLAVPGSVSGTLTATHIRDTYKVTVPVDGDVTFTTTTDSNLYCLIQFFDTGGKNQLNYTYSSYGTAGSFTIPHLGPGATYYVTVTIYEGSGGSYTLTDTEVQPPYAINEEPNDTPKEGIKLTVGGTATGHVGYSRKSYYTQDNVDYYKYTIPADGDVTVNLTTDSTLYALVQFWDIDGKTQINYTYSSYGNTGSFTVPHLGPGATYYISVSVYSGYGSYQLGSSETLPPYAKSSTGNNTPKKATAIGLGKTVAGLVGYSTKSYDTHDNVDYYKVTPNADGDMTVNLTTDSTLYALVQFYDTDGVSQINYAYSSYGSVGSLTVPHLGPSATYYISVSVYSGYGSYQLSNSLVKPKEKSQKEPDGSFAQAHPLVLNKTTTGLVGYSTTSYNTLDTADYFSVPGKVGTLMVNVTSEPTLYALIQIWDGNGNQLAYFYTGFGGSGQTSVTLQSGGSYFVSVSVYSGYGGYTLKNTFH